jgi:hypothetical protein
MGTLLTKAIEAEFEVSNPVVDSRIRAIVREELERLLAGTLVGLPETTKEEPTAKRKASGGADPIYRKFTQLLHELGVPAHLLGYRYLREAFVAVFQEPSYINNVTKTLYPMIADRFSTTGGRVERSIRFAIELSWSRGNFEALADCFGGEYVARNRDQSPTNAEYIATVVDHIRVQQWRAL